MGWTSCIEDQLERFESDYHLLHAQVRSGKVDGESAKKEALRLLGDARVYWCKTQKALDEMTDPGNDFRESSYELLMRCSYLETSIGKFQEESSRLVDLIGLFCLQNQMLHKQLKHERRHRKQLEKDFEKLGQDDFGRMVEPFLTKGMFERHAKR